MKTKQIKTTGLILLLYYLFAVFAPFQIHPHNNSTFSNTYSSTQSAINETHSHPLQAPNQTKIDDCYLCVLTHHPITLTTLYFFKSALITETHLAKNNTYYFQNFVALSFDKRGPPSIS